MSTITVNDFLFLYYTCVCVCPRPPLPRTHITLSVLKQKFLRILCHQVDKWRMQGATSSLTAIHGCSSVKPVKQCIGFYFLLDFQTSWPWQMSRFIDCVMRRWFSTTRFECTFTPKGHCSAFWWVVGATGWCVMVIVIMKINTRGWHLFLWMSHGNIQYSILTHNMHAATRNSPITDVVLHIFTLYYLTSHTHMSPRGATRPLNHSFCCRSKVQPDTPFNLQGAFGSQQAWGYCVYTSWWETLRQTLQRPPNPPPPLCLRNKNKCYCIHFCLSVSLHKYSVNVNFYCL